MSQGEYPNQPQGYCTNCGAEIRSDTKFCVSCGASLSPEQPRAASAGAGAEVPGTASSLADSLLGKLRGLRLQERTAEIRRVLSASRPNLGSRGVRQAPARVIGWFRDLPSVPKLVLAGLILLALVVLLSPVMRVVAILAFLVSAAVLILHGVQRRFVPRWGIAAASSLVLIFVFGGISGTIYGSDPSDNGAAGAGGNGASQPPAVSEQRDPGDWESTSAYIADMIDSEEKVDSITDDVSEVLELTQDGYMSDSEAVAELSVARDNLDTHRDYFRGTAPPEGFEQYHRLTLAGWDLYSEGLSDMEEGARYYDMDTLIDGFHTVEEGVDTIEEANQYIPTDVVREESL